MDLTENIVNDALERYPNEYPKRVSPETLREIANIERRAYIRGREDESKLRESQKPDTSDEALHIGSVVESFSHYLSEELKKYEGMKVVFNRKK